MNKLGNYITQLMTTVIDLDENQFVKDLALEELKRLDVDINSFIRKHSTDDTDEAEKTEKQLLQEDKYVKDK